MYEVVDGDRSFTALIRGGQNAAGAARFDGVILAGWRAGARVQVVYQRYLASAGMPSCEGAPAEQDVVSSGNYPRRCRAPNGELTNNASRAAQCRGMRKRLRCESVLVKT